jgi:hypothetical protein
MPTYDRGDPPQNIADVLRFLREELQRLDAYTHAPRTDGAWDDLRFPAQAIGSGATAPAWDTTYGGQKFSATLDNEVQGVAQMPHAWRQGTNIRPHIHWQPSTGTALGAVATVWEFCYVWRNNGEAQGARTCHTVTVTPTASSTMVLMITSFPELDGTGKNISSIIDFTLKRLAASSAADNMGTTANLKEFDIHYLTDSFGSDKEYAKD